MAVAARRLAIPASSTTNAQLEIRAGSDRLTARFGASAPDVYPGPALNPQTVVQTDPETLAAIQSGASGIEAFLDGRLTVRGNLALALQLDAIHGQATARQRYYRTRRVRSGTVDSFFLEAGRGRPVVILHGLGATNASVLPMFWHLAAGRHVVAPDLPGHGETAKPVRAYTAKFYAQWLSSFLDTLGLDQVDLIGHSMGGRIALEAGFTFPERIRRLVLVTPATAFMKYRHYQMLVRVLRPEVAAIPTLLLRRHVMGTIRRMFAHPERVPEAWLEAATDEFLRVFRMPRGRIAFFSAMRQIYLDQAFGPNGFWDRLQNLQPRSLFLWGSRDWLVPSRFARHVLERLPNTDSVVLRDCGHVPQYEQPETTLRLLTDFLA